MFPLARDKKSDCCFRDRLGICSLLTPCPANRALDKTFLNYSYHICKCIKGKADELKKPLPFGFREF